MLVSVCPVVAAAIASSDAATGPGAKRPPIIDVHLHAYSAVESADFLTPEQRRDILYNNAARFLKLDR